MYRNILLALVSAIALTGSAAFAADLPSRAPPPVYLPPPPVFTWTGIYIGGQVGYAWSSGNFKFFGVDPISGIAFSASGDPNPNGVIGGGHVGYQYQINQWVLGIEGSVDGTSLSKTAVVALPGVFGGGATVNAHSSADIQGSNSRQARHCLGPRPDLRHRRCRLRRLQHRLVACGHNTGWRADLRLQQLFEHPGGLDRRRWPPICRHQQLVDLCRIPLFGFRQRQQWALRHSAARGHDLQREPSNNAKSGPGRLQL